LERVKGEKCKGKRLRGKVRGVGKEKGIRGRGMTKGG
jgi:hypothetical protein